MKHCCLTKSLLKLCIKHLPQKGLRDIQRICNVSPTSIRVTFDRDPGIPTSAYVLLHRNGIIESVADDVTWFHPEDTKKHTRWFSHDYIRMVPARIENYFELYRRLEVPPPIWFFISFLGLDGSRVWCNDLLRGTGKPIR